MAERKKFVLGTCVLFYHEQKSFSRHFFSRLSFKSFNPEVDPIAILASREIGKSGQNIIMIDYHDS